MLPTASGSLPHMNTSGRATIPEYIYIIFLIIFLFFFIFWLLLLFYNPASSLIGLLPSKLSFGRSVMEDLWNVKNILYTLNLLILQLIALCLKKIFIDSKTKRLHHQLSLFLLLNIGFKYMCMFDYV